MQNLHGLSFHDSIKESLLFLLVLRSVLLWYPSVRVVVVKQVNQSLECGSAKSTLIHISEIPENRTKN